MACQTSQLSEFNKVKTGMDKDQVMVLMGNPERTERLHSKDRWTYVFYDERVRYEKEIHFLDGISTYVGEIWEPEASKSWQAAEKEKAEIEEKYQSEIVTKKERQVKASSEYLNYEKELRHEDKVRYMPEFTPVK